MLFKFCKNLTFHSTSSVHSLVKTPNKSGTWEEQRESVTDSVQNMHTGFTEGPHFTLSSKDPGISERFQILKSLTKTPPGTQSFNTISETSVFRTDRHTVELNCTIIFWWLIVEVSFCLASTLPSKTLAVKLSFPSTLKISVTFEPRRLIELVDAFCPAICTAYEAHQFCTWGKTCKIRIMINSFQMWQNHHLLHEWGQSRYSKPD